MKKNILFGELIVKKDNKQFRIEQAVWTEDAPTYVSHMKGQHGPYPILKVVSSKIIGYVNDPIVKFYP